MSGGARRVDQQIPEVFVPDGVETALEKLGAASGATRAITRGAAHLCIGDPSERRISDREGFVGDLLASHPPLAQRVIRLRGMAFQQEKRAAAEIG